MKIFTKTGFKCPGCNVGDVVEKKSRGREIILRLFPLARLHFPDEQETGKRRRTPEALAAWKAKPPKATRTYGPKKKLTNL